MCTVTFIAVDESSFYLTSNRDEHILRLKASPPENYLISNKNIFFPKDPQGGGTWLAVEKNKSVLCLLNGAFQSHERNEPYAKSRGLVVLDFFNYNSANDFVNNYSLEGIEPFTLIIVESNPSLALYELRWDEKEKYFRQLNHQDNHIWSSCTLYNSVDIEERENLFANWQNNNTELNLANIRDFHLIDNSTNPKTPIRIQRENGVQTVSVSTIAVSENNTSFIYQDLVTGTTHSSDL
jgi:hypothetical protein